MSSILPDDINGFLFDDQGQYDFDSIHAPSYEGQGGPSRYLDQGLASESMALSHFLGNQTTTLMSVASLESSPRNPQNIRLPLHLSPLFQQRNAGQESGHHSPQVLQPSTMAPRYSNTSSVPTKSNSRFPEVNMAPPAPIFYAYHSRPYDSSGSPPLHHSSSSPRYLPPIYPPPDHPPPRYLPPSYPPSGYPPCDQPHAPHATLPSLPPNSASQSASFGDDCFPASAISQRPYASAPQFISPTSTQSHNSYDLAPRFPCPSGYPGPVILKYRSYSRPLLSQAPSIAPGRNLEASHGEVQHSAALTVGRPSEARLPQLLGPPINHSSHAASEAVSSEADSDDSISATTNHARRMDKLSEVNDTVASRATLLESGADIDVGPFSREPALEHRKSEGRATSVPDSLINRKRTLDDVDCLGAQEQRPMKRTQAPKQKTSEAARSLSYRTALKEVENDIREYLGNRVAKKAPRYVAFKTLLEMTKELDAKTGLMGHDIREHERDCGPELQLE